MHLKYSAKLNSRSTKWHSNQPEFENEENTKADAEESFAKPQLGIKVQEVKLFCLVWDTAKDTLSILLGTNCKQATK